MPTGLADLLTATERAEAGTGVGDRVDAAAALGHSGRALAALRRDGISRHQNDLRERQVHRLAQSCLELANSAPQHARESRRTELSAVLADAAIIAGRAGSIEQRWAITVALSSLIEPLSRAVMAGGAGDLAGERARQITSHVQRVWQTAALNPPTVEHNAVLDAPIPTRWDPRELTSHTRSEQLLEAAAVLLHDSRRPDATPYTIAEAHAVSGAAQMLTRAAASPDATAHAGAFASWAAVRESLRPFHDGSRRPDPQPPPRIEAARELQRILTEARPGELRQALTEVSQDLPALADSMRRSLARNHNFVALARDLPFREERLDNVLRGGRGGGAVRPDTRDLIPVTTALMSAKLSTAALAADLTRDDAQLSPAAAANRVFRERPDAIEQVRAAQQHTLLRLQEQPRPLARPLPAALADALNGAPRTAPETRRRSSLPARSPAQMQAARYARMDEHPNTIPPTPHPAMQTPEAPPVRVRSRQQSEPSTRPAHPTRQGPVTGR